MILPYTRQHHDSKAYTYVVCLSSLLFHEVNWTHERHKRHMKHFEPSLVQRKFQRFIFLSFHCNRWGASVKQIHKSWITIDHHSLESLFICCCAITRLQFFTSSLVKILKSIESTAWKSCNAENTSIASRSSSIESISLLFTRFHHRVCFIRSAHELYVDHTLQAKER